MEISELNIVYMGTPDFAVAPLEGLLEAGARISAVVTAPDRPAGRGKKLRQSAVKEFALSRDIPVLQPEKLREPAFLEELNSLKPDLQVVVAFRMLPELVWQVPKLGTFNLHASLLPRYRGAAPINHVLINGEKETGVTTFLIDKEIDTGNILLRESLDIRADETAGELHDRLMHLGAKLVVETASGLAQGKLEARDQNQFTKPGEKLPQAPKISKEDCRIHWDRDGKDIVNLIRGMSPYPGAWTRLIDPNGKDLLCKVFRAHYIPADTRGLTPGSLVSEGNNEISVAVRDGEVLIENLQVEGKKRMETVDFLRGFNLASGSFHFS